MTFNLGSKHWSSSYIKGYEQFLKIIPSKIAYLGGLDCFFHVSKHHLPIILIQIPVGEGEAREERNKGFSGVTRKPSMNRA